jgi:glycosyltransferase involved in cell wall biosynthesis
MKPLGEMRLVVVSHVVHYRWEGRLYAYGPYAREIALWAELFREIAIASPCRSEQPPGDCIAFETDNVSIMPQKEAGGHTLGAKLALVLRLPAIIVGLLRALAQADAIHVRCPGNLGLLGVLLAPLFGKPLVAKYAAQWNHSAEEGRSLGWQKRLLASSWWRGPVTVYGECPGQPAHVISFFTSLLSAAQMERARAAAQRPRGAGPFEVLYTGRLSAAKHVDAVLRAVAAVRGRGYEMTLTVVGEGPERPALEKLRTELGMDGAVDFTGGLAFERVLERLERADILALVSETEGWPKALAEGMAFGLIAIGSNRGFVPKMLGEGRGLVVCPGDADGLARQLMNIAEHPAAYEGMRREASAWAQRFSLEGLREAIRQLLLEHWTRQAPEAGLAAAEGEVSKS